MATYPTHIRKLRAVELVINVERLKEQKDRDLDIDHIIEKAKRIEAFVNDINK